MTDGPPIALRPYGPGDEGFCCASWARHIRPLPPFADWPPVEFNAYMRDAVAELLGPDTGVVACSPDCPDQVFGFVCAGASASRPLLHFLYVKAAFRRLGIASCLLAAAFPGVALGSVPLYLTHPGGSAPHHRKRWGLIYAPQLAGIRS